MLLFVGANGAIASSLSDFSEHAFPLNNRINTIVAIYFSHLMKVKRSV